MSINIKIKEKPDLKKMEISELIDYMENDFNFKTFYSYEELKETAEYLRELAEQGNVDAQYAYATFYPNSYFMPWYEPNESEELRAWEKDVEENEWYQKAILTYEAMNSSDPKLLLRIGTAYINKFLGDDTITQKGVAICDKLLNIGEDENGDETFEIDIIKKCHFKACLEVVNHYNRVASDIFREEYEKNGDDCFEDIENDEFYEYEYKADHFKWELERICNNEDINADPVAQCIHGARTFHSARYNQAAKWYRRSAEQGYTPGMCYYANCLSKGIGGVEKNVAEAENWYSKAIENGLNYALLWLGDFYLENSKIYSNAVEDALECYELAAECGVYDAYKKLYKCYAGETKYPFEKNEEKAAKYLEMSKHEENLRLPDRIASAKNNGGDVDAIFNFHDAIRMWL